jgi:hypothetical protein
MAFQNVTSSKVSKCKPPETFWWCVYVNEYIDSIGSFFSHGVTRHFKLLRLQGACIQNAKTNYMIASNSS